MTSPVWYDRCLQRTNPVYVIQERVRGLDAAFARDWTGTARLLATTLARLPAEGVRLPAHAVADLKQRGHLPADFPVPVSGRPGVLGLVVQEGTDLGFVLPLACRQHAEGWRIDEMLPFDAGAVADALVHLVQATDLPAAGLLPERLAFSFENPLGQRARGNSMTVAAVLAILDELGGHRSGLLRCACAVVQPGEGGRLEPVKHIEPKLRALLRECGGGSLLVVAAGSSLADEIRSPFQAVWEVRDFRDLARALAEAGILTPLLDTTPLERAELQRVRDRLAWLVREAHRYREASELGARVVQCKTTEAVPVGLRDSLHGLTAEAARHQGNFVEAAESGRQRHDAVQERGRFASYDDQADADAEYASDQFDRHDFESIGGLLEPWARIAEEDPQRLRPQTRVKVLNTLGRALVILQRDGWEKHFQHSRELLGQVDPRDAPRTLSYLIHGLLRHDRREEGRRELEGLGLSTVSGFSGWMLRFLRADLARRDRQQWADAEMDAARPGIQCPGHPFAFYCQATARQIGCADAPQRLRRAADFLRADAGDQPNNICSLFADCVDLFAAAQADDRDAWRKAVGSLRRFLDAPDAAPLRRYYAPALVSLNETPAWAVAEHFLRLIPYF